MKKSFLILAAFAFCATSIITFSACNKEGVYKPKQKISKIYYEETEGDKVTTPKRLKETWTWEKKKLTKIAIEGGATFVFSYDGNQVSKIASDNYAMNFSYEKKKLDKIEILQHGTLSTTIAISERDGDDKITKLTYEVQATTEYQKSAANNFSQMNPIINLLFPNAAATALLTDMNEEKSHKAVASTIVYEYTYEGNNITKVKRVDASGETVTLYHYDSKKNPYYKSLYYIQDKVLMGFSENNITLYYDEDKKMYQKKYELKYNEDDFPTSIAFVEELTIGSQKIKRSKIDHIEYVD